MDEEGNSVRSRRLESLLCLAKLGAKFVSQIEAATARVCANECCAPQPLVLPMRPEQAAQRQALIRQAFRLEWLTIGWMIIEVVVAITSGIAAGCFLLVAFRSG